MNDNLFGSRLHVLFEECVLLAGGLGFLEIGDDADLITGFVTLRNATGWDSGTNAPIADATDSVQFSTDEGKLQRLRLREFIINSQTNFWCALEPQSTQHLNCSCLRYYSVWIKNNICIESEMKMNFKASFMTNPSSEIRRPIPTVLLVLNVVLLNILGDRSISTRLSTIA